MKNYSPQEIDQIKKKLKTDFTYWYHKIDLGHGIVTPGFDYDPLWDNIRKVRHSLDYRGKTVLDIASFDGLWAFEAEKLGAKSVVATDCLYRTFNNFLFCRDVLGSQCLPYYNVSPYHLSERLDVFFQENYDHEKPYERMFDIVQHLGLFYHLRDPLLSLSQARSCMKTGGQLLIETNIIMDRDESFMLYNGIPFTYRVSDNYSVWWVPTVNCLKEMLIASLFEPKDASISVVEFTQPLLSKTSRFPKQSHKGSVEKDYKVGRLCMTAKAVDPRETQAEFVREMQRTFRNPGLNIEHS
jgi:tRNA (mo5U34)-methyltransferase